MPSTCRRILAEPLLHFLVIGAALVVLLQFTGEADPRPVVTVDPDLLTQAEAAWAAERGREPGTEERAALRAELEDEALLLAEARAMALDRGDPQVRQRLADLAVLALAGEAEVPTEDQLRTWFEADPERWAGPARVIVEVRPAADAPTHSLGPVDRDELTAAYGEAIAAAAFADEVSGWSEPLPGPDGPLQLRVAFHQPALEPDFEQLRFVLADEWQRERFAAKRAAAVAELRDRYRVESPAP